ncbi:hypothetical protein MASR2M117_12390 [Paludibacter sp.]
MKGLKSINGFGMYLAAIILSSFITSCTEPIEFSFESSTPQLVVEAKIAELQFAEVHLSKTANINRSQTDNCVRNALIIIEDNMGNSETLTEIEPGRYLSSNIRGKAGVNYKLSIMTDDQPHVLKSEDIMPKPVNIKRLRARKSDLPGSDLMPLPEWEVVVEYDDPADEVNYYRFVEYINGVVNSSYVESDKLNNGKSNKSFLTCSNRSLKSGDTLTVEMQSISKSVYEYFYGFSIMSRVIQGTSGTNPTSNVTGANLGYFSAYSVHRKTIIIE